MKQKLVDILEKHCPNNVYLQGTMNPDKEYPAEFVTFWTLSTADAAHYDNFVASVEWSFSVIYYSNDPVKVNTKPLQIAADMRAAGFIPQGKGNDILSDEQTHTGWAMEFAYTEKINKGE